MCDLCKKHGGGEKWYFNPKNYSKEMGEARLDFLEKIAGKHYAEWVIEGFKTVEQFKSIPVLNKLIMNLVDKYQEREHGAQVLPLDDAMKVLELCENPALLPCECRLWVGNENYCCLNFGLIPELYEKANPNTSIEELSVNKAKRLLKDWNKKGYYHLILWSKAPYTTTICNCTTQYCTGYKGRSVSGVKTFMLKSEYVARVNTKICSGCKNCLIRCPFGAIFFNIDDEKAFVDIRKCFGCGLCKMGCKQKAISLIDRKLTPAKNFW